MLDTVRDHVARNPGVPQTNGVAAIQAEINRQRVRLDRLTELYMDQDLSKEEYLAHRRGIEEKIALARGRLPPDRKQIDWPDLIDQVEQSLRRLSQAKLEVQKILINSMLNRVEISEDRVIRIVPRDWIKSFFV